MPACVCVCLLLFAVYFCISEEESFDFKNACRDGAAEVVADGAGERAGERERERYGAVDKAPRATCDIMW